MISLNEYLINEIKFPFTVLDLMRSMEQGVEDGGDYNEEDPIYQYLEKTYSKKHAHHFFHILYYIKFSTKKDQQEVLLANLLKHLQLLKDRRLNVFGAGMEGFVLELDKDKVIKFNFEPNKGWGSNDVLYKKLQGQYGFVKCYKYHKNYVVLEKVVTNTPQTREYSWWAYKYQGDIQKLKEKYESKKGPLPDEIEQWILKVEEVCKRNGVKFTGFDLGPNNLGVSLKDGTVKIFDI